MGVLWRILGGAWGVRVAKGGSMYLGLQYGLATGSKIRPGEDIAE